MKKRVLFLVSVSFFHVVAVLFLLVGGFLFVKGRINVHGIENVVSLEELSLDSLEKGVYVEDDVYTLVGTYPDAGLGAVFCGTSTTQSAWGGKWYNTYTVNIGKDSKEYVMVAVLDVTEQTALWDGLTDKPSNTSVKLFGKVIPNKYSVNEPWHLEAFGIEDEALLKTMISYDFCINVVDKKQESSLWYKGLSLFFTGAFIWFASSRKWGKAFLLEIKKENNDDSGNQKGTAKKNYC